MKIESAQNRSVVLPSEAAKVIVPKLDILVGIKPPILTIGSGLIETVALAEDILRVGGVFQKPQRKIPQGLETGRFSTRSFKEITVSATQVDNRKYRRSRRCMVCGERHPSGNQECLGNNIFGGRPVKLQNLFYRNKLNPKPSGF